MTIFSHAIYHVFGSGGGGGGSLLMSLQTNEMTPNVDILKFIKALRVTLI